MLCVGTGTLIDSWSQRTGCVEAGVLNRSDRPSPMAGEAEVKYLDGDFRVVRPGAFVRCAVTGLPIPLEELKYWSVDLQEAYVNPEAVLQRHFPNAGRRAADDRR
jgi:hypothetical protein